MLVTRGVLVSLVAQGIILHADCMNAVELRTVKQGLLDVSQVATRLRDNYSVRMPNIWSLSLSHFIVEKRDSTDTTKAIALAASLFGLIKHVWLLLDAWVLRRCGDTSR